MTRRVGRYLVAFAGWIAPLLASTEAAADDEAGSKSEPNSGASEAAATGAAPSGTTAPAAQAGSSTVEPSASPERATTAVPKPAEPPPPGRAKFAADPIADGAIVIGAAGFAGLLDLVNSTGEVRPQQISPTFDRSRLLGIDRGAVSQHVDPNARTYSNIGVLAAAGFAVLDPILSGIREQNVQTGVVDAFIYAETMALTWGVTNLAKMAVRRPRPQAYIDAAAHKNDPNYSNNDTDSSLSFFSGHSSFTASISATATYLAFARSPHTARPWITLGVGTALTAFVATERVRGGAHFPTDVITGAIVGASIGVIVPHVHRSDDPKQRPLWVGYAPERNGGGTVQLSSVF